jgi:superkiller protein 3
MDPAYPRVEFALGRALLRTGKVQDAITHLQAAVEREPQHGEAHYQLGLALSRAGRQAEGTAEIQKSRQIISASERDQTASLDLAEGKSALDRGEADQAIDKFRHVLSSKPDAAEPHYLLGVAFEKKGNSEQAIAEFRRAFELNPGNSAAKESLDRLLAVREGPDDTRQIGMFEQYIADGKFEELEPLLRAYLAGHPKSSWGWYALGYSLYAQRKIGDSIRALAQALQLDIKNANAHKVLGRDLMIIGRFDAARLEFQQGAKLDPKSPEMPYNLGKLYSIEDNWADARKQFELALRLDSSYMEAYDGLGFAMEALGDDTAAVANYKKAIELGEARQAKFSSPYVNMSALSNRTGEHAAALEYARKGLENNPRSDRALYQMAKAYEYQGNLTAAVDALIRAIAINNRASSYFYVLGTLYRRLGKPEESRKAMESFSKLDRESNELDQKRRDLLREDKGTAQLSPHEGAARE